MKLGERLLVNVPLELDDRLERDPVVVPAPGIEFGFFVGTQLDVAIARGHAQQEPDLLLSAVGAAPVPADPLVGDFVAQPLAGAAEDANMVGLESGLFLELPEHCLL